MLRLLVHECDICSLEELRIEINIIMIIISIVIAIIISILLLDYSVKADFR